MSTYVVGGIYNFDTWEPGGPNASNLATLSYYQTFLNKQVELKVGYLANVVEYWKPFLTGNLASSTAAYTASIAPGIRVGIGLGYTDHPTPVIFTPQTGSVLNLLANVVTNR